MNHPDETPRENRPDPEALQEQRPTEMLEPDRAGNCTACGEPQRDHEYGIFCR